MIPRCGRGLSWDDVVLTCRLVIYLQGERCLAFYLLARVGGDIYLSGLIRSAESILVGKCVYLRILASPLSRIYSLMARALSRSPTSKMTVAIKDIWRIVNLNTARILGVCLEALCADGWRIFCSQKRVMRGN